MSLLHLVFFTLLAVPTALALSRETSGPTAISGLGPIFGTSAEASAAVIKMPPVIGSDATPAITGLISSTIWK